MEESPVNVFALDFSVSAGEKGQKLGGKKNPIPKSYIHHVAELCMTWDIL